MSNQVRIIDNLSGSTLFETQLEKMNEAYAFAALMEEEGLDVRIESPGLAETLIKSLGADEHEIADFKQSLDDEINAHSDDFDSDFGCAVCPPTRFV